MTNADRRALTAALLAALYPCPRSPTGQHITQGGAVCVYCKRSPPGACRLAPFAEVLDIPLCAGRGYHGNKESSRTADSEIDGSLLAVR